MPKRLAATLLFAALALSSLTPIRSYDYFWHLATGRWIVEHRALPEVDPFAVASARVAWINGEWLWEVGAYGVQAMGGHASAAVANALLVAAIFTLCALRGRWGALAAGVAFAGAAPLLGVRPATAAALLIAIALALLQSSLPLKQLTIAYALLTVVWINVHPSALLAPVLAAVTLLVDRRRILVAGTSAVALLANPFGWRAIEAPLRLTAAVTSGEYVNAEWLPSTFANFPLLYVTLAAIGVAFVIARKDAWRFLVFILLGVLAVRHVRNQGLYFAALPLLLPPLEVRIKPWMQLFAIVPIAWVFAQSDHHPRVDGERFPLRAVSAITLPGNIYNSDQFGGLLEWTFYPQRRTLTDGRNELFRDFIAFEAKARLDSRQWRALLMQYRVDLAVAEYEANKIEVVDVASGERRALPASLVRYRRRDWALIAFDDAAMVFARRAAFPREVLDRIEYRYLVPDDPSIGYASPQIRDGARAEIARARQQFGDSRVIRELAKGAN